MHWITAIGIDAVGSSAAACAERVTDNTVTGRNVKNETGPRFPRSAQSGDTACVIDIV